MNIHYPEQTLDPEVAADKKFNHKPAGKYSVMAMSRASPPRATELKSKPTVDKKAAALKEMREPDRRKSRSPRSGLMDQTQGIEKCSGARAAVIAGKIDMEHGFPVFIGSAAA